jgi:signal transduction histidine kinase/CheY-like chemotaxis protein
MFQPRQCPAATVSSRDSVQRDNAATMFKAPQGEAEMEQPVTAAEVAASPSLLVRQAAQLEEMNRRLRSLLELGQRVTVATSTEDCISQFCAAMRAELVAAAPQVWRGELTDAHGGDVARACAREARRTGQLGSYEEPASAGLDRFGLIAPIPVPRAEPDLICFSRSAPFTEQDQAILGLALSFLDAALRAQAARQELRESQAQLHQSERMKSIGQLAGGVAHDFNNMLMVMSAAAEVMADALPAEHPCTGHLNLIINTTHRAAELTQKLLVFSRKGRLAVKVVDVHDVLGAVREFLVHALDRRITLQLSLAAGPCMVEADSTQLQNALLNICLNARDAMPNGGLLRITTRRVELDSETCKSQFPEAKPGSYVRLEVRDTGTGMDDQTLKHAFDPFFTTKEPGRGTGLGLSVVFGAIREHGGALLLESQPGRGTCCVILLPLIDQGRSEPQSIIPHGRENPSLRVLLLDDEPTVCRTAAQLLRQLGHNVQALQSGEKALNHLRTHSSGYDLLVLDLMMPHPTGVEVHRALCDEGIVLPTIFVSGYTEQHLLDNIVDADGVVFLQKPFRQTELARAIARCMQIARAHPGEQPIQ